MGFLECDDPECLAHFPGMVDNGEWDVIHRGQGGRRVEPYGKALGDVETPKRLIDFLHIHSCDPADDASKYGFIGLPMKVACKVLDFLRRLAVVMHYADASFLAQALGYYKQYAEWARLYSEGPKLREPKNSYRYPTACVYIQAMMSGLVTPQQEQYNAAMGADVPEGRRVDAAGVEEAATEIITDLKMQRWIAQWIIEPSEEELYRNALMSATASTASVSIYTSAIKAAVDIVMKDMQQTIARMNQGKKERAQMVKMKPKAAFIAALTAVTFLDVLRCAVEKKGLKVHIAENKGEHEQRNELIKMIAHAVGAVMNDVMDVMGAVEQCQPLMQQVKYAEWEVISKSREGERLRQWCEAEEAHVRREQQEQQQYHHTAPQLCGGAATATTAVSAAQQPTRGGK